MISLPRLPPPAGSLHTRSPHWYVLILIPRSNAVATKPHHNPQPSVGPNSNSSKSVLFLEMQGQFVKPNEHLELENSGPGRNTKFKGASKLCDYLAPSFLLCISHKSDTSTLNTADRMIVLITIPKPCHLITKSLEANVLNQSL
jgi:hypothetical protein